MCIVLKLEKNAAPQLLKKLRSPDSEKRIGLIFSKNRLVYESSSQVCPKKLKSTKKCFDIHEKNQLHLKRRRVCSITRYYLNIRINVLKQRIAGDEDLNKRKKHLKDFEISIMNN